MNSFLPFAVPSMESVATPTQPASDLAETDGCTSLAQLLLKNGFLNTDQIVEAQRRQRASEIQFDQAIVQMGICTEGQLSRVLGHLAEVRSIDASRVEAAPEYLMQVPLSFATENVCLPIHLENDSLLVAMADPTDREAINDISGMTGQRVLVAVSPRSQLLEAISRAYRESKRQIEKAKEARQELREQVEEAGKARRLGRSFSIISNKGGVGKTHTAINIAYTLARAGYRTLIIDADLSNADVSNKLRLFPMHTLADFLDKKVEIEETKLTTPFGFDIISGKTGEMRLANMKYFQRLRFMKSFARMGPHYDYIIYDLGAGVSLQVIDFALCADDLIVVTTPRDVFSGYACAKLTFLRHIDLETRLEKQEEDYEARREFRPWLLLNQVETLDEARTIFKAFVQTAQLFAQSGEDVVKAGFQFDPRPLGGVQRDSNGYVRSERSHLPYCQAYPHSPNIQNYRNLVYTLTGLGHQTDNRSNLQRVAKIVSGGDS